MPIFAVLLLVPAGGPGLDPASVASLEVVKAAALAAKTAHTGFAARMEYACDVGDDAIRYVRRERAQGSIRWDGRRVQYEWFKSAAPERVEVCAYRDGTKFVRAERYDERLLSDFTTFEVRPPLATVGSIESERLAVGDPALWFCGATLDLIREGLVGGAFVDPVMRNEGEHIVFRSRLKIGPTYMVRFNGNTGFLADRVESVDDAAGKHLLSEQTYDWAQQDGRWVLLKGEWVDRWIDGGSGKPAESHKVLAFSDVRVNEKFSDKDFSPDELPIPLGSLGLDKRALPFAGLIRDVAGIVPRSKASPEARAATKQALPEDHSKDEAAVAEAEAAAAERSAYRWSVGAKACAVLAAAAVGIFLFSRHRTRAAVH